MSSTILHDYRAHIRDVRYVIIISHRVYLGCSARSSATAAYDVLVRSRSDHSNNVKDYPGSFGVYHEFIIWFFSSNKKHERVSVNSPKCIHGMNDTTAPILIGFPSTRFYWIRTVIVPTNLSKIIIQQIV